MRWTNNKQQQSSLLWGTWQDETTNNNNQPRRGDMDFHCSTSLPNQLMSDALLHITFIHCVWRCVMCLEQQRWQCLVDYWKFYKAAIIQKTNNRQQQSSLLWETWQDEATNNNNQPRRGDMDFHGATRLSNQLMRTELLHIIITHYVWRGINNSCEKQREHMSGWLLNML